MEKRKSNRKFKIEKEGTIEENIERLQKELEIFSKGAPSVGDKFSIEDSEHEKPDAEVFKKKQEKQQRKYAADYSYTKRPKRTFILFKLLKNPKLYIVVFGLASFAFVLVKTPVFRYTTPFRPDIELPQIEIGFRYYNNIFGRQTKSETIINTGKEKIIVHLSMATWVNMNVERKLLIIRHYQK